MATITKPAFKIGQKVSITRTGSKHSGGKVTEVRETGRGTWFDVNVSDNKRVPIVRAYRAGDLQRA